MNIKYQYANGSNTSVLLKIDGLLNGQTICLLIDPGKGVNVNKLLNPNRGEYLSGVLLTHLHLDHYSNIGSNIQDGARIYTSPQNKAMLETVLADSQKQTEKSYDIDEVNDAVVAIDSPETIVNGVTVTPVPAGHTPGAVAFYIEVDDGTTSESVLVTGDFTRRSVAGYPGLPIRNADCIILNGTTNDSFDETITKALNKTLQDSLSGSPTLVTATGLSSVHFAYLLGHTIEKFDQETTVDIVGQAAKLYKDLEYDVPNVNPITEYDPKEILDEDTITISGPETPTQGGSKVLFDQIRNDENASLIQLTSNTKEDIGSRRCTANKYWMVNHPTEETLEGVVDILNPESVVVFHQSSSGLARYRHKFSTVVWAPTKDREYTIYKNGEWAVPPVVKESTVKQYEQERPQSLTLPNAQDDTVAIERKAPDLKAEGVKINHLSINTPTSSSKGKYSVGTQASSPKTEVDTSTDDALTDKVDTEGDVDAGAEIETETEPKTEPARDKERATAESNISTARILLPTADQTDGIIEGDTVEVTDQETTAKIEQKVETIRSELDDLERLLGGLQISAEVTSINGNEITLKTESKAHTISTGDKVDVTLSG